MIEVSVKYVLVAVLVALAGCGGDDAEPVVFEKSGANAAAIQATVDAFRGALGANNGVAAAAAQGRREVNWDGVPAARLDPFPGDFFINTSPRGIRFSTPGTRMKVSGDPATPSFEFADVTAPLPDGRPWGPIEFSAFSPSKMFAPIDSVETNIHFFVPGTSAPATVTGFGAVFSDIDLENSSAIELYGADGSLLFKRFLAKAGGASKGFTFFGVTLEGKRVARVRILAGSHPINTPFMSPPPDGVAIDDVIYAEPVAIQ